MGVDPRGKNIWAKLTADMQRYAGTELGPWSARFLVRLVRKAHDHPGLLAVVVYRYGQWVKYRCRIPVVRPIAALYYYYCYNWVRTRLHIELPYSADIAGGLRIYHFSCVVHGDFAAGKNLSINHGVIIGSTETGVPRFGDNVRLTTNVTVIGGITLGNNVLAGAGAVVTKSFPDNSVVAGVPARLMRLQAPTGDALVSAVQRDEEMQAVPGATCQSL